MTQDLKICIWLNSIDKMTSAKALMLLDYYGGPTQFAEKVDFMDEKLLRIFGADTMYKMNLGFTQENLDRLSGQLEDLHIEAVTIYDPRYPGWMKYCADPPFILYCRGNTRLLLEDRKIAVVGSRKNTAYGRRVVQNFVPSFVDAGYVTVSGLAVGTDETVHEETLKAGGKTIAVLGSGLCNVYPAANRGLAERIVQTGGLLISEYPPYAKPAQYHFPQRNRIVTGISKGLVIVEAGMKSGVYSTFNHAIEQGRDIFIVPGEIYSYGSMGSNDMLRQYPQALVTSAREVIEALGVPFVSPKKKPQKFVPNADEKLVIKLLKSGQKHYDELLEKTGFSSLDLNFLLATMEIRTFITKLPSNYYVLNTEALK